MKELDINSLMENTYNNDLPNVWQRIQEYYQAVAPETLKGVKGLEPGLLVDFYEENYGLVLTDFHYTSVAPSYRLDEVAEDILVNNGNTIVDDSFSFTKSSSDSFKFGFTEGLKIGTKASAKIKLPFVGEGETELSAEIAFSANQEWSTTSTKAWAHSTKVPIPSHSSVKCVGFIKYASITSPFKAIVKATDGKVLVTLALDDGINLTEWLIPLTVLLSPEQRTFSVSGVFSGAEGISVYSQIDPINSL